MSIADIERLKSDELREAISKNVERDPAAVALDRGVSEARLVATQVKYLQRARHKLPRLYEARCIIPPRAFEQSSSEDTAWRKHLSGGRLLDLTCGLGIDTLSFSEHFERVVALERDEVLAEVVRYNLGLLGVDNVEVITTSAEEYLATTQEHFDWVFADPDRRSEDGRKMVCMEDCSPNMLALMPRLEAIAKRVAIKLSPMFDVDEAFRLCSPAEVEVVSVAGECKEINIYTRAESDMLRIAITGVGEWSFHREDVALMPTTEEFVPSRWRYLLVPDVAVQKGRVTVAALRSVAKVWSNNGYGFAEEQPTEVLPCRCYEILSIERYHPKELKRRYKGRGVEIMKRDTRLSVEEVRRSIGATAGSQHLLAVTSIAGENFVIELKQI